MHAFLASRRRLRAMSASGLMLLTVALSAGSAAGAVSLVRAPAGAPGLLDLGLALDDATREGMEVVFPATEEDLAALAGAGIPVAVVIADLERFYAERLLDERSLWEGSDPGDTPGFGFGSMGGFYTWSEVVGKLDEMRADYPALVTAKQSLGLSHEGRDIWMVKISDNADQNEGEPAILYTGLTHAREPMGMEVILYTMFYLLESYGVNPEATYLVNEREMFFVPVLNPDGYVYNQTTNPAGGGGWRKNRRDSGGGIYGVDLNRNYGYLWGYDNVGSSPTPSSGTYRGPGPFSEPETSAIRGFHQGRTITTAFHYHAYGGYEIHPFAYAANALPPAPDLALYERFGSDISAMNGYLVGNFAQTLGYVANGESLDWSYGEQIEKNKVFAFLPEVGTGSDGFWPLSSRIVPLAELHLPPNLYWTWIAGARAELDGVTAGPEVPLGAMSPVVVAVENRGLGAAASDLTVALASSDPYVTIGVPEKPFPVVPPLTIADNSTDPLEFFVSGSAPPNHGIALEVTLWQGNVQRGQTTIEVSTPAASGVAETGAPGLDGFWVRVAPNPMGEGTEIRFAVDGRQTVDLTVVDVTGRVRRHLRTRELSPGEHRVAFDGRDDEGAPLPGGIYVVRLRVGPAATHARLVVLR